MKNDPVSTSTEDLHKLRDLVESIKIAMLTTISVDGTVRSHPMATQQFDLASGTLWFFTADQPARVGEIYEEQQVGLAYASPEKQAYVSTSGRATTLHNEMKTRELWAPAAKIWFPRGIDDPTLALLKVEIESADYWDVPSSRMVRLYGLAKAAVTGGSPKKLGEHVKIKLR